MLIFREHRCLHATKGIRQSCRNFPPHCFSTAEKRSLFFKNIDTIVIFELKVGAKMLKMLSSALLGRRTAKVLIVKEKNDKKGNQRFLVMKSFRRTFYTRVEEDTLYIKLAADIELIYHHLPLQYNL